MAGAALVTAPGAVGAVGAREKMETDESEAARVAEGEVVVGAAEEMEDGEVAWTEGEAGAGAAGA